MSKKTIALVVDYLDSEYQNALFQGIKQAAEDCDYNLITFSGIQFNNPREMCPQKNDIFSLITCGNIDGVIIITASLGHYCTQTEISEFVHSFLPLPVVSISVDIPGIPSILVDNNTGFKELLTHLIAAHHYQHIAFIKGTKGNQDAEIRYQCFLRTLQEHGLVINQDLIFQGNFTRQSGYDIIKNQITKGIHTIDVIVSANDEMAWGALDALDEYNIPVPGTIALTGFDDNKISKFMYPSITTVTQPFPVISEKAVSTLKQLIDGETVPETIIVESRAVIRRSCGCKHPAHENPEQEVNISKQGLSVLSIEKDFIDYRASSNNLADVNDTKTLLDLLEEELPHVGIDFCSFSYYSGENLLDYRDHSFRTLFVYHKEKGMLKDKQGLTYPARDIIPRGIFDNSKSFSIVAESIFIGNELMGILTYSLRKNQALYTIMLHMFINNGLKAAFFVHKITETNNKLSKALETLEQTQEHIIESEKMAALGTLVTGIAHEINTPIGIGVTAASHLEHLTMDLQEKISGENLKKSELEDYSNKVVQASRIVLENLKRSKELISSFKQIAVDQTMEEKRSFNIKVYLLEILLSLQPRLNETKHTIHLECPDTIEISGYPGTIAQIITHFILNSITHGFESTSGGIIEIKVTTRDNTITMIYKDNGKGIPAHHMKRIFEPFFTTNRKKGGTGLGLHLVYNLVTQRLKGTINCTSTEGKGTVFTTRFPAR